VKIGTTLTRFITEEQRRWPQATGDFTGLLNEAAPLAFIAEQAGGKASDGIERIMDIVPGALHQRIPLFIGSASDVDLARKFVA